MSIEKLTELSHRIKEIRDYFNLNKKEFAERLGISPAYITEIESGKKERVSKMLAKLISCEFGVNLNWIEKGEGAKFEDSSNDESSERRLSEFIKDLPKNAKDSIIQYAEEKWQLYQLIKEKKGRSENKK